ncbi:MAG: hypothetical protein B7C24_08505 [Bacteroidetes bacterium 4572_77]|nr:MAG: hypothetical protein B7C24_08505 [Bacteroidetes bacterium 4572_77]
MGIIQRQSVKGLIFSYLGAVLGFVTTGILMPKFLATSEIGLIRVLVSYASLLAQFSGLGFSIVVVKMFPYFRDAKTKDHGFMGLFLMVSLVGFLLSLVFYYLFHHFFPMEPSENPMLSAYIWLVWPLTVFILLFTIADTYYRSLFDAIKGTLMKEVWQRIFILGFLLLFVLQLFSFSIFLSFYVLAYAIPALYLFFNLWKDKRISLKPHWAFLTKKIRKKMSHIAFFGMLSSFSGILVINIDVLMIEHYLDLNMVGIYTITFFFGALILIPARPVTRISSIIIAESFKKNDQQDIRDIYKKSSITLLIISVWVWVGLAVNMENIMQLIGEDYRLGYYVILIIGLSNVLDMSTSVVNQIIFNSDFYKYSSYLIGIFALLLIVSNIILLPKYGINGAAIATLFSKIVYDSLKIILVYKKLNIFPYTLKSLWPILIGLFSFGVQLLLPVIDNYIIDIIVRSIIVSVFFMIPILLLQVSEDINSWWKKIGSHVGFRAK